jgi:hypothetical protein
MLSASAQAHLVGYKLDDAKCSAAWIKASPNGDPVYYEQAEPYIIEVAIVDMDGDSSISQEEFRTACVDGYMRSPEEITQAMEKPATPAVDDPIEKQYARMIGAWDAAGPEARQRFREYMSQKQ